MKKWFLVLASSLLLVLGYIPAAFAQGDVDCGDFNGNGAAIAKFWVDNGYSATNDPHDLDRDGDGLPCEASQADINSYRNSLGGAAMPNTATNNVTMAVVGAGLAGAGLLLALRRKKGME